ncbi:cryptochrome/photolyase family protein [Chryseobacterium sp. PTM-20240506]|uniref:cryptochrome/photolyase family protein n=1 Tax=unclassified Chryseobacterium TaxID=2593645 RepID=UPI002359E836|nr:MULTISPECIES: cryptochrome/photolyase family protein [unclassified Chryseobacterium]MDC8104575.1 cryptochrome/photolyase family protein [Chryseobacterium sp. B21-037]MDQ1806106.1 cryptochrome/photolyase family protein [Chryseobacterium sp. CKR4-1]
MAKIIKHTAQLIFPHQLFEDTDYLIQDQPVFLIEEFLFFRQYAFHKQKIAFHRATMKFYEHTLKKSGFEVEYIESSSKYSDIRNLILKLENDHFKTIKTTDVCDNWLEKRLRQTKLDLEIHDSSLFLNTKEELKDYFEGKKSYHQTDFYKQQRITRNILMKAGKPLGGKWTYDTENRRKYPKNKKAPFIYFPTNNQYYEEAKEYTEKHFSKNYGILTDEQLYPTTFKEAEKWLEQFLEMRFPEFGIYEDSIVEKENFLHHSVLSPLMNVGLLTAENVLEKAISFAKENDIPVNSLEGFVRQILGWREFVRGVYLYQGVHQRNKNYWKHKQKLPASFYTAKTGIQPVDSSIQKILKTGYAHHIERLMIFANLMNLCQFDPDEVYQWFMEMFIDSYDWVMVPNVYGMSTFSDGGKMSTKPYISGSNYIKKMSDYPNGEWAEQWDALFWNFINDNKDFFAKNPRLGMMLRTLEKMPEEQRKQHIKRAKEFIENLK